MTRKQLLVRSHPLASATNRLAETIVLPDIAICTRRNNLPTYANRRDSRAAGRRLHRGFGVDHPLLFGPAQRVGLVLERLRSSQLSIHEDDDRDVLRVRH